jgi:Uma2 family endonuclease
VKASRISVDEYLTTNYNPDVEFVDGMLVERNVGDWQHSLVQSNLIFALRSKYPHLKVVPELRSRITATRYRLPDVCVLKTAPATRYLLEAAFLVIEVLSEGDVMSNVIEKLKEYASKGVENIWLIDPRLRELYVYRTPDLSEVTGERIATTNGLVELSKSEIFAE